ncbi:16384_t:CDS:2 [Acaulospora morrowiae]|uniref:16384_t:CDS:1 n=1 Tax=Acaulospora morrowiae TaxID=94023 RepID=A0A9N9A5B2_9GLOM|nr:16384_t:CDS:2 [Acaulospora morrowiae]
MTVYLKLLGVSKNKLDVIKRQLEKYELTMRIHGNIKRLPQRSSKVIMTHNNAKEVSSFILNYADINGLSRPGSHLERNNQPEDKEELLVEYASHIRIAKLECEYYNDNIKKAKENDSHTINIHSSLTSKERPIPNTVNSKSFIMPLQTMQSIPISYSPQKIGPLYFKNEGEFPVGVVKSANTTLSLIYDTFIECNRSEKNIKITCDNCEGQNKNNATIAFYC